ncbi:MAG: hypothetical protein ACHQJ7_00075 [Vicinamibacteria bacterium]|jgi:hypothetical protein
MAYAISWHDLPGGDDASQAERRIWRTGALSLLVHAALLVVLLPHLTDMRHSGEESPTPTVPISVVLVAPPPREETRPTQAAAAAAPPQASHRERVAPRPALAPPPIAALPRPPEPDAWRVPIPSTPSLPEPPRIAPRPEYRPTPTPLEGDLTSYIASQRASRGESPAGPAATASERDAQRRDLAIKQNLAGLNDPRPLAGNPKNGGGLFQITLKSYDFAEFKFFGWNSEIGRQAPQRVEVRKGTNPTIDIAIVRRMIAIIRETQKGDFTWRSDRSGRDVTLSARPEDNERLENFLMQEMFGPPPRPSAG